MERKTECHFFCQKIEDHMKTTNLILLFTVVLTVLSAGLGFANAIGYIPAMEDTLANHLLSFWQQKERPSTLIKTHFEEVGGATIVRSTAHISKEGRPPKSY